MYLCASIHVPTTLSAVVSASRTGTFESVKFDSIRYIPSHIDSIAIADATAKEGVI